MPQMSSMDWFLLYCYFMYIYYLFMILLYFFFYFKFKLCKNNLIDLKIYLLKWY